MATILDGIIVRDHIREALKTAILSSLQAGAPKPTLAIVQIGALPESTLYIEQKKRFGESIGAHVEVVHLDEESTAQAIRARIATLSDDTAVHGIIVQLPLPSSLQPETQMIIDAIDPKKDVDGMTSTSRTKLAAGAMSGFLPATTRGIISLLAYYHVPVMGKKFTVVGRSALVGTPTAEALRAMGAEVTVAHSKTPDVAALTRGADSIIVAVGKPALIGAHHVSSGQTVIDVGINVMGVHSKPEDELPKRHIVGDVDAAAVAPIVKALSPVPGGVGPLTVASLFQNLMKAYTESQQRK
jgi:methylenetetrahydrofolate dehydrogenase (NADP+) / methenyltetrahydrofolate cyclohydrolase